MLLPTSRRGDNRNISKSVLSVLLSNIKQTMRRKVVLILAVPILFLLSIFFLMSDIKNIPDTNLILPKRPAANGNDRMEPYRQDIRDKIKQNQPPLYTTKNNKENNDNNNDNNNNNNKDNNNDNKEIHNNNDNKNEEKLFTDDKVNNKFDTNDYDLTKSNNLQPEGGNPKDDNKNNNNNNKENTNNNNKENKNNNKQKIDQPANEDIDEKTRERQNAVREAYLHSWKSYERYAWGLDELQPPHKSGKDWLGMGLSIIDSIDTMWLMGLQDEYKVARNWVKDNLNFENSNRDISFFETTIRVLGGLVSIYDLTGDDMYLQKAEELGTRFLPAFNTRAGYAYTTINLKTGRVSNPSWAGNSAILSECGTVQLEFSALSRHTGNREFREKAMRVYDKLNEIEKPSGLYPVYLNIDGGGFSTDRVTLGALGDSFYEYLLKIKIYRKMYDEATQAVISQLVKKSTPGGLTFIAEKENGRLVDKMDHLVCFAGAMFALENTAEHMALGEEITRTCHEFYLRQQTGLSPEIAKFTPGNDFYAPPGASHYILRPETVESYFVLYWLTKDTKYQDWGWEAFQAMEKHCRTPDGYCGVRDVTKVPVAHDDVQQSFFMAETLKYLYLLFSPRNTVDLNDWVFNTEAHPIKVWK